MAVQLALSWTVCSRDEPEVPQPLHDQLPENGCGPSTTVVPVFSEAADCTTHEEVPLMLRWGVTVLGWQVCAHAGALSAASVSSTLFLMFILSPLQVFIGKH